MQRVEGHIYCKFGSFCEKFIFANSAKRHICHVKNLQLWADLAINEQQSDFTISQGLYFHETLHVQSFKKIKPSRKFTNLQ